MTAAPLGIQNVRYDKLTREAKQEMQNARAANIEAKGSHQGCLCATPVYSKKKDAVASVLLYVCAWSLPYFAATLVSFILSQSDRIFSMRAIRFESG